MLTLGFRSVTGWIFSVTASKFKSCFILRVAPRIRQLMERNAKIAKGNEFLQHASLYVLQNCRLVSSLGGSIDCFQFVESCWVMLVFVSLMKCEVLPLIFVSARKTFKFDFSGYYDFS